MGEGEGCGARKVVKARLRSAAAAWVVRICWWLFGFGKKVVYALGFVEA